MSFKKLTSTFSSPSLLSSYDPSPPPPPPMPPPATSSSSPTSAASSISSSSSSSSSSASTSSSLSSSASLLLSASTSPLTPRTRLAWRAPPSPRRRPLPHQWMHPTTTTSITTLTPTSPASAFSSPIANSSTSSTTSSSVDRAATPTSPSLAPSSLHDPLTSLRFSAYLNDPSSSSLTTTTSSSISTSTSYISSPDRLPRMRQHPTPLLQQRLSLSAPCSPALSSRPSQLVFASGAVGTASALGHVFGRPLQAKETIPCSPLNCTQWQKEPPQSLAQQAQSPSHTFQQQCAVHKRFRLFRQRPRRCQVHASSYHHGGATSSKIGNGPNYILPPTTVYPLVVRPDKILLDHPEEPPHQESRWPSLPSSISMSSRLSLSTVSLALSMTNTTTSSTASFQTHGSEDDEGSFMSNGGTYHSSSFSSSKAKKLSKKERQLQKRLQKQEQQRQQQQQQKLRCLCYLDTSLDYQPQQSQQPQQPQKQHFSPQHQQQSNKVSSWHPQRNSKEKEKEKDGRLRRIWNESVIFHWSKPPGGNGGGNRQSTSSSPSPSPPSTGYHHHTVNGGESSHSNNNNNGSQVDLGNSGGVPMRHSLSGTDISDEGNHSLSDIEDDLDNDHHLRHLRHGTSTNSNSASRTNSDNNYSHHRVSFQGPSSSAKGTTSGGTTTSRPKDDLKAIARHQAELSLHQKPHGGDDDFQYGLNDNNGDDVHVPTMPHMPAPPPPVLSNFGSHIIVNGGEDEDDDDEDWDVQSDSGAPSSSLMYSADVREPSCRSTLALPMSTPANNKAYLKKPSIANLNGSIRSRQRCLSLPADTVPPGKGGFLKMSSKSSENWDEDFDIESTDIHVPTKVVENQMSLQMDLYNIKDFASQIEDLKTLRASLRTASSSLKATNPTKHQHLSVLFQRDWEQAEVIIDLGEIAQTSGPTTPTSASSSSQGASLSLQHSGKKASEPSLATLSTKPSGGFKPRRPVFSTSAPAANHHNNSNNSPLDALSGAYQVRSESQSSNMTGTTLVAEAGCGDDESDDTAASTRTSSRSSSSVSASESGSGSGLKVDIEAAVEKLAVSQATTTSSVASPTIARGSEKGMRKASMAFMKESCSSPAGLGLCTLPMTPLRTTLKGNDNDYDDEDYDDYHDGDLEIKYDDSVGLLRFPDGEQPFKGGFHEKEDSSATVKPLSPRSPRESGAAFQVEVEASPRRNQKYSHFSKRRTTGGLPSSSRRLPADDVYTHENDDDEDEEDDGYESYGHGDGSSSSIGIFTPIPSDRHMQVLKDILMEGLGTEVAGQYMFKQGEQDHVRFSVEVIPGLLGHLKGLQQRLGDQLQQLTVIV